MNEYWLARTLGDPLKAAEFFSKHGESQPESRDDMIALAKRLAWGDANAEALAEGIKKAGIPPRYADATTSTMPRLWPNSKRWLYLHGDVGTGKTHAACALSIARCQGVVSIPYDDSVGYRDYSRHARSFSVLFHSVPSLLLRIKNSFRDGSHESEYSIVDEAVNVGVLVLDDLSAEKSSEWSVQILYAILNGRYNEMRETIITSNRPLSKLGVSLAVNGDDSTGLRIVDRIYEMSEQIAMNGKSRRATSREKENA